MAVFFSASRRRAVGLERPDLVFTVVHLGHVETSSLRYSVLLHDTLNDGAQLNYTFSTAADKTTASLCTTESRYGRSRLDGSVCKTLSPGRQ